MLDHLTYKYINEHRTASLDISKNDISELRKLSYRVKELSNRSIERDKIELWYKHNSLQSTRPLVHCNPENGWNEIITTDQLKCINPLCRFWEFSLRKEIYWGEKIKDDHVIQDFLAIPYIYEETDWGLKEIIHESKDDGAYSWEPALKDYEDIELLHFPRIEVDYDKTNEIVSILEEIFDGQIKIKKIGLWWWTLGLTWKYATLRGLEKMMYDFYDYPEMMHRLMAFLRDGYIDKLDFLEKENLLTLNNDNSNVGSGGLGFSKELPQSDFNGANVRLIDLWGFAESQETVSVSPEMFKEFIFPYQLPILNKFGLNHYGCCEPLNKRWDTIRNIPRLRRVSVSPWADVSDMAEKLSDEYIYSFKAMPMHVAVSQIDEAEVRTYIRKVLKETKNCKMEIILQDTHTIGKNPRNITRWCEIVNEEINC